ncbi:MAG: EscU/YscU/HrcU family type III secretion system export apparatus switch protein [Planctomycetaceae bacterium]|nr:EscU/YscU/HrcU family type III secretion system export apparatus switch protein [Planctomycetaceae bacterium]
MAEESQDSKTEAATPRRREQAREQGQVVNSPDLQAALQLLAGAGLLTLAGDWFVREMGGVTAGYLTRLSSTEWTASHTVRLGQSAAMDLQRLCVPFVLVILVIGILSAFAQAGPLVIVPLKWNWERLDPRSGWNRLCSLETLMRGTIAVCKAALIASVAIAVVFVGRQAIASTGFQSFEAACGDAWDVCRRLLLTLSGVTLGLGVLDFGFKWYRHEQQLKLSRQELKEEQKEDAGDPHLKARLRKLQHQATLTKGLNDVPKATVVLTNPTHLAIALRYEHGVTAAPIVLAKGEGLMAQRIRRIAEEHRIPIQERRPLVRALYKLVHVGQEIPMEFYQAIAEILSGIYRARNARSIADRD